MNTEVLVILRHVHDYVEATLRRQRFSRAMTGNHDILVLEASCRDIREGRGGVQPFGSMRTVVMFLRFGAAT